jgi:hypothetical protein
LYEDCKQVARLSILDVGKGDCKQGMCAGVCEGAVILRRYALSEGDEQNLWSDNGLTCRQLNSTETIRTYKHTSKVFMFQLATLD